MEYTENKSGDESEVKIKGKFTFLDHINFKAILNSVSEGKVSKLSLNLAEAEFIDSAALGVLLLLKDEADKKNIILTLKHPKGQVKKMFEISKFYDLFIIID